MGEQVKIFTGNNDNKFNKLEAEVNTWLSENKVDIVSRKITSAAEVNQPDKAPINCTIVIFYNKKK